MTVLIDSWTWIEYWKGGKLAKVAATYIEGDEESVVSTISPYVWVILPLALFLSGILMEPVRPEWLAIVCLGTFLLNSNLAPSFLSYEILPLEIIGNIMTSACLVILYLRPSAAFCSWPVKQ